MGRVARRIWAVAMRDRYGANERSQKLKYHVQTSGRSLHAQEMQFNDIRTTLQALIAIYDNCNSLHTNAFDEAITTPTEDSVRRAMAIQLIINREWGLAKNENPNQGAFIVDELTELVEEAVLAEFEKIAERGGVLGAMETGYQRGKIQEESMHYEMLKHTGEYPIVGVNTFRNPHGDPVPAHDRAAALDRRRKAGPAQRAWRDFHARHASEAPAMLQRLQQAVIANAQRVRGADGCGSRLLAGADHGCAVRGRRAVPAKHVGRPAAEMGPPDRPAHPRIRGHRPRPVRRDDARRHGRRRAAHRSAERSRPRLRARAPSRRHAARPAFADARSEESGRRRSGAAPGREGRRDRRRLSPRRDGTARPRPRGRAGAQPAPRLRPHDRLGPGRTARRARRPRHRLHRALGRAARDRPRRRGAGAAAQPGRRFRRRRHAARVRHRLRRDRGAQPAAAARWSMRR